MKHQTRRFTLLLISCIMMGLTFTFSTALVKTNKVSALPNAQLSLTPTPFFRFPVVPNVEVSGLFDHNGTYPNDTSNQYITFHSGRESIPGNGFQFSCTSVGEAWVGCEIEDSSEADCPDQNELWYDTHHGVDYEYATDWRTGDSCDLGQFTGITHPVYSPAKGKVDFAGFNSTRPANGYHVILLHDLNEDGDYNNDGLRSFYLHFAEDGIAVVQNDIVDEGQYLGEGGMSGLAWTPHLHFEVQRWIDSINDWAPVDPYGWTGNGDDPWPYDNYSLWRYDVYLPLVLKEWPPIPDTPILNQINNPRYTSAYSVSWNLANLADIYTLQEATTLDFSDAVMSYTGTNTSWEAIDKTPDTYYYRVKATNAWGDSAWSNIEPTTVLPPVGWQTITSQDFEGTFPGVWNIFDDNGGSNGEYEWAKRDCQPYAGSYSGWSVGGGNDGLLLNCGNNYPSNADSWMQYGPFSLEDVIAGELRLKVWRNTEETYDKLSYMASINGVNFHGYAISGDRQEWVDYRLDLTNVPTLGNLMGETEVWIALVFSSDGSVTKPEGVYVDNIILRKCSREPCSSGKEDRLVFGDDQSNIAIIRY